MTQSSHKSFGIIGNPAKEKVRAILPKLLAWFHEQQQDVCLINTLSNRESAQMDNVHLIAPEELAGRVDLILALGGDGTILHTARLVGDTGTPILGIRLGGLGFLAEVYLDEIYDRMHRLLHGRYNIEQRMTLQATVKNGSSEHQYVALNDFVVHKARPFRMVNIRVSVNGDYLNTYSADGLIVSSPTGSTAYSLAVQGPIIVPTLEAMVINPISPHSLTARPVVVPASSSVSVQMERDNDKFIMSVDGQIEVRITEESLIDITRGSYPINLVVWKERTFFDVLRRKMQWGGDPRNESGNV